jgi:amidase
MHDHAHAFMPYPPAPAAHAASGALAQLTLAVKDLFDVAGYPTSGGSPTVLALSGIKTTTAPTVQKLLDAGAHFVGKTVTDELAFSLNGQNAHFGSPINGAAPNRIAGGSSSGSASAVSNGLCDIALGTDTGGSVRGPASHCGLIGLRPTHGLISLQGALDLAPSFDTCGWFARDVGTFARVAGVLLSQQTASSKFELLWPQDLWEQTLPAAQPIAQNAAQGVQTILGQARPVNAVLDSFDAMFWSFRYLQGREAWLTHGALIERYALSLGPGVAQRFAFSRGVTDAQVAQAQSFRTAFRAHLDQLLGETGVLLFPTMPDIAPLTTTPDNALEDYRNRALRMLCVAGLAGVPQLSLPLCSRDGAPFGLSLLGRAGSDRVLIALAEKLAAAKLLV